VFGSLATLIGAIGAYFIGKLGKRWHLLIPLPTVLSNAIIVPFVLIHVYGATEAYPFLFLTVFVGEVISAGILGMLLYRSVYGLFKK